MVSCPPTFSAKDSVRGLRNASRKYVNHAPVPMGQGRFCVEIEKSGALRRIRAHGCPTPINRRLPFGVERRFVWVYALLFDRTFCGLSSTEKEQSSAPFQDRHCHRMRQDTLKVPDSLSAKSPACRCVRRFRDPETSTPGERRGRDS